MSWVRGRDFYTLHATVDPASRLFKCSLRIGGWSHTFAGIMKSTVVACCSEWPRILTLLRSLCRFFRQEPYRRHIVRKHPEDERVKKEMKSYTASLAKWRFETFFVVLTALHNIMYTCLEVMPPTLF